MFVRSLQTTAKNAKDKIKYPKNKIICNTGELKLIMNHPIQ